jgi:Flp pilus assembly protein TadD
MAAAAAERWIEAAGSVRLAIAFDPRNPLYRERFGEIQPRAHEVRFEQLVKEAESALSFRDRLDALRIYEEALHFRPYDGAANFTAARLAWLAAEDLHRAKEYAARACEADPENAEYRKVLGLIYKAAGLPANARRELQKAVRLDPADGEARAELKSL